MFQELKQLLEEESYYNQMDPVSRTTLLNWACKDGWTEVVELLLKHNVDVNLQDESGNTPLIEACRNGRTSCVELLLE